MAGNQVEVDHEEQVPVTPEPKPQTEKQYVTLEDLEAIRKQNEEMRKQMNGLSYMGRKVDEVLNRLNQPTPPQPAPIQSGPKDELDSLLETDWKKAVRILAKEEAATLREQERQEQIRNNMISQQRNILEENKRKVIERHPDLIDQNSETAINFMKVLNRHPEYLNNEYGPILAMREMEEEMRQEGKLDPQAQQVVQKEVERQARVNATSIPSKSKPAASASNKALTSEDLKLCKENGINPDTYLRMKNSISSERQAEV